MTALTRDDVLAHAHLVPADWKPTVQSVTNKPHCDRVLFVELQMRGLGSTAYDLPVITVSDTSRGGYAWRADVGGELVGRGLAFGLGSAVGYAVMALMDARRAAGAERPRRSTVDRQAPYVTEEVPTYPASNHTA